MRFRFDFHSIRTKALLALGGVTLAATAVLTAGVWNLSSSSIKASVDLHLENNLRGALVAVRTSVRTAVKNYLRPLTEDRLASDLAGKARYSELGAGIRRSGIRFLLVGPLGERIADTRTPSDFPPVMWELRDAHGIYWVQGLLSRAKNLYDGETGTADVEYGANLLSAVYAWNPVRERMILALGDTSRLASLIQPSDFRDDIVSLRVGKNGIVDVFDSRGVQIIHSSPRYEGGIRMTEAHRKMIDSRQGRIELRESEADVGGNDYGAQKSARMLRMIYRYERIPELEWTVAVGVDRDEVFRSAYSLRILLILFSIVLLALLVAVALRALDRLVLSDLFRLKEAVDRFGAKNFSARADIPGNDEISHLAASFNRMADTIYDYSESMEEKVRLRTDELAMANRELSGTNRMMTVQLHMARRIQQAIFPTRFPMETSLRVSGSYLPMEDLGGDFYDLHENTPSRLGMVVADVSGHGVPAALITMMAKVAFAGYSKGDVSAGDVMQRANADLCHVLSDIEYFVTAFYGIIDFEKGELEYSNAGHIDILLLRAGGTVQKLASQRPFLGKFENIDYQSESVPVHRGDRLVLYTDGILEARSLSGEEFGSPRLLSTLSETSHLPPEAQVKAVLDAVRSFHGKRPPEDDITLLVVDILSEDWPAKAQATSRSQEENSAANIQKFEKLEMLLHEASALLLEGDIERARTILEEELAGKFQRRDDRFRLANLTGHVYFQLGDFQRAYAQWSDALSLSTENAELARNIEIAREHIDGKWRKKGKPES